MPGRTNVCHKRPFLNWNDIDTIQECAGMIRKEIGSGQRPFRELYHPKAVQFIPKGRQVIVWKFAGARQNEPMKRPVNEGIWKRGDCRNRQFLWSQLSKLPEACWIYELGVDEFKAMAKWRSCCVSRLSFSFDSACIGIWAIWGVAKVRPQHEDGNLRDHWTSLDHQSSLGTPPSAFDDIWSAHWGAEWKLAETASLKCALVCTAQLPKSLKQFLKLCLKHAQR